MRSLDCARDDRMGDGLPLRRLTAPAPLTRGAETGGRTTPQSAALTAPLTRGARTGEMGTFPSRGGRTEEAGTFPSRGARTMKGA